MGVVILGDSYSDRVDSSSSLLVGVEPISTSSTLSSASSINVSDHGSLSGLGDDDHSHYLNNTRGDIRYLYKENTDAFTPDGDYEPATKKYVDDNSDINSFENGLTEVANVVKLGGALTGDTTLTTTALYELLITTSTGYTDLLVEGSGSDSIKLSSRNAGDTLAASLEVQSGADPTILVSGTAGTFAGVEYNADYSAQYTDRSLVDKAYVLSAVTGSASWEKPVIDKVNFVTNEPTGNTDGDRYINSATGVSSSIGQSVTAEYIYEWNSGTSIWDETIPGVNYLLFIEGDETTPSNDVGLYKYNGSNWVFYGVDIEHNETDGKQGGIAGEYFHLTDAEATNVGNLDSMAYESTGDYYTQIETDNYSLSGDLGGTLSSPTVVNDSHTHDTQYFTKAEITTWRNGVSQTEMGFLNGITEDIQTALDTIVSDHSDLTGVLPPAGGQYHLTFAQYNDVDNLGTMSTQDTGDYYTQSDITTILEDYANIYSVVTPVLNQIAFWQDANTIRGDANLTWDLSTLQINGTISATGYNDTNWNTAYTHSQVVTGNPHSISYSDVIGTLDHSGLTAILGDGEYHLSLTKYNNVGNLDSMAYESTGDYYTLSQVDTLLDSYAYITGTPVLNQLAIWHAADTIKGDSNITWDGSTLQVAGTMAATTVTGANVTSGSNPGHTHTTAAISNLSSYTGFDARYYTKTELNTDGEGGQVHWNNLVAVPASVSGAMASFNIDTDGEAATIITDAETILFSDGSNMSVSRSGNTITFASTQRGIDSTPVSAQETESISSGWAYNHVNSASAHHTRYSNTEAVYAVASADDYLKNDANDTTTGTITAAGFTVSGGYDVYSEEDVAWIDNDNGSSPAWDFDTSHNFAWTPTSQATGTLSISSNMADGDSGVLIIASDTNGTLTLPTGSDPSTIAYTSSAVIVATVLKWVDGATTRYLWTTRSTSVTPT